MLKTFVVVRVITNNAIKSIFNHVESKHISSLPIAIVAVITATAVAASLPCFRHCPHFTTTTTPPNACKQPVDCYDFSFVAA